ncbi:MAG: hypothetical protein GX337_05500 [Christensenellaceae bacterium]|nr:hypothetical protein [Christensenellaceae bacterium]
MREILLEKNGDIYSMAYLVDGKLYEYSTWGEDNSPKVNSIYLAKITRNMPSINACFVSLGNDIQGFLPHDEIPYKVNTGDFIIVQVKRPADGDKAAYVSGDIAFVGKYIIYLPYSEKGGVSSKIEDKEERGRLHNIARGIEVERGAFVMRSISCNADSCEIVKEAESLISKWNELYNKLQNTGEAGLLIAAPNALETFLRDNPYNIDSFISNIEDAGEKYGIPCKLSENPMLLGAVPDKLSKALRRRIHLKSGANICIDPCEAMTVIDVNSAKSKKGAGLSTNIEAAREVARLIRLRKISGIIMVDFIDMQSQQERDILIDEMKKALSEDSVKTDVLGFTRLGIMEITRKRSDTALASDRNICPYCKGSGIYEQ